MWHADVNAAYHDNRCYGDRTQESSQTELQLPMLPIHERINMSKSFTDVPPGKLVPSLGSAHGSVIPAAARPSNLGRRMPPQRQASAVHQRVV